MEYREYKPETASEKEFIKLYWSLKQNGKGNEASAEPVLPDGCMEVVFDISDRFVQYFNDGSSALQPRSIIAGQLTSSILIGSTGKTDLFGIRFQPAGASAILGFSAIELTDRIEDLANVIGSDEHDLFEQMSENTGFSERIVVFRKYLYSKIGRMQKSPGQVMPLVELITESSGNLPISRIANEMQWSERRLERHFREFVGLTPKLFARITRFQAFMQKLERSDMGDIHDLIYDAGYYDQSHMIRDFREFTGRSPLVFIKEKHIISDYFIAGEVSDSYNT